MKTQEEGTERALPTTQSGGDALQSKREEPVFAFHRFTV